MDQPSSSTFLNNPSFNLPNTVPYANLPQQFINQPFLTILQSRETEDNFDTFRFSPMDISLGTKLNTR